MDCVSPIHVRTTDFPVPCGKCYACLANNRAQWIFRIECEYHAHPFALFVTLTYSDDFLPYLVNGVNSLTGEEMIKFISKDGRFFYKNDVNDIYISVTPSVNKRDIQLFVKRLRKSLSPNKCRFFCTAEYGKKTSRPHYHLIMFFDTVERKRLYDLITQCWPFGNVQFGECEPASIAYTTKYCLKETKAPEGALKPFRLMSNRPAIGDIGYKKYLSDVSADCFHRTNYKNLRAATPRLWRDKYLNSFDEEDKNIIQAERLAVLAKRAENKYERWHREHPNGTLYDYSEYLRYSRSLKEELIKKRLTSTKL